MGNKITGWDYKIIVVIIPVNTNTSGYIWLYHVISWDI